MANIKSINEKRVVIEFSDFCIRVFTRYKNGYCSEIRVWKLPPGGSIWSMFNKNNLVWAMYGDDAKMVQGWFTPPPVTRAGDNRHWLNVLADEIAQCEDYSEIEEILTDAEKIISDYHNTV